MAYAEFARIFSDLVGEYQRETGIKKTEIAARAEVTPGQISHLIAGRRIPRRFQLINGLVPALELNQDQVDQLLTAAQYPLSTPEEKRYIEMIFRKRYPEALQFSLPEGLPIWEKGLIRSFIRQDVETVQSAHNLLGKIYGHLDNYQNLEALELLEGESAIKVRQREFIEESHRLFRSPGSIVRAIEEEMAQEKSREEEKSAAEYEDELRRLNLRLWAYRLFVGTEIYLREDNITKAEISCNRGLSVVEAAGAVALPVKCMLLVRHGDIKYRQGELKAAIEDNQRAQSLILEWVIKSDPKHKPTTDAFIEHWGGVIDEQMAAIISRL